MPSILLQIAWLLILAIPVACISWTVTHEEIFQEFNNYCKTRCANAKWIGSRKFFYLFTCEYCFSHYITILILLLSNFTLLLPGWKGYIIAGFSIVWISNIYMCVYNWLRLHTKNERIGSRLAEKELEERNNAD